MIGEINASRLVRMYLINLAISRLTYMFTSIAGGINLFGWYALLYRAICFISVNKRFETEMPNQIITQCHFFLCSVFLNLYSFNVAILFY